MIDWDAQPLGEVPDTLLAQRLGVSYQVVYYHRHKRGLGAPTGSVLRKRRRVRPRNARPASAFGRDPLQINGGRGVTAEMLREGGVERFEAAQVAFQARVRSDMFLGCKALMDGIRDAASGRATQSGRMGLEALAWKDPRVGVSVADVGYGRGDPSVEARCHVTAPMEPVSTVLDFFAGDLRGWVLRKRIVDDYHADSTVRRIQILGQP